MPTTQTLPKTTTIEDLSRQDVCDRCVANATVRVQVTPTSDLLFCGHHATKYGFADHAVAHVAYAVKSTVYV